ncbi:hypothetical protein PHYPSEUDO_000740 [Phytophthora pseudosyringae]|uniref:Cyclic nucleotide-binding domain-containing protein n=1 Tax=Phytophthora pseudosyringae TaxID=221518 RepID=A0A8T1WDY9_9STRA|nr:hypothetical protein PHYPSEUDO_000740 [Phytophthora pseudosyringae]
MNPLPKKLRLLIYFTPWHSGKMGSKILAGGTEEGPSNSSVTRRGHRARRTSRRWRRALLRIWDYVYHQTFEPVELAYKRLSLRTRQTIRVGVSLYAVLYHLLTVPFRIAFYYEPRGTVHSWGTELSVYVAMDAVADVIGMLEFLRLYRLQTGGPTRFANFSLNRATTTRKFQTAKMTREPSFDLRHQAETKWTLADMERDAPMNVLSMSRRDAVRERNLAFALEIVALAPVETIPYALGAYNALHLVRMTKLCRLYRLQLCIERIASIYSDRAWVQHLSSAGVKSLVRSISLYTCLGHWFACGYMLIAHTQCGLSFEACSEEESSWVIRDRLLGASTARKYARSLYWASRTILLMGFDEVVPVSDTETMYVILVTILGGLFASSLLASFLFIFRFWNARYAAFATHVDNAREYMRSQNIPRALRRQVIAYLTYSWSTHHSLDSEEALHLMPKHLQLKVVSALKASRIKQVCFLAKESVEFVNLLAAALVRQVYAPVDHISEPKANAHMFFVIRGRVVLSAASGSNAKECKSGDFFADVCLLFPDQFDEKAVAKTFCELYVLPKAKFDDAMSEFYREKEADVRAQMAETLEKHSAQLLKTKKLLGVRERTSSGQNSIDDSSHDFFAAQDTRSSVSKRSVSWRLPGSLFRVYWDAARLLAILYVVFEVPYFAVFSSIAEDQGMFEGYSGFTFRYSLSLLVEMLFGVSILLRARVLAHLDPVVMLVVEDPELIFAAYKAHGFYLDLIAWLPVGVVLESLTTASVHRYAWCFRFLRLLRLREVPELLWNVCDYYSVSSKTHLVMSLLLGVTLMLHVVGCIWFEMAWVPHGDFGHPSKTILWELTPSECLRHATTFSNCSWVVYDCYPHIGEVFPAEDPASTYQAPLAYLRSVYWAIVTLTTVGYGDITAYSTGESFFAAFWIFVGGILNFAVIGAMSSTISSATAPHRDHMEKLNALNSTLERMEVSATLSSDIRRFYHLEFNTRKQAYESQLLSNLPDKLCYEISSLLHAEAVKSVELFDSATIEFLKEVTGKFRHRSFQNGDTICLEGGVCREFFVFVRGSKVNVFFRSRKVPIRALRDGDCHGVNEFLLRRAHPATLTAASVVHASVMTREQFDSIQRKFDEDLRDMKEEAQLLCVDQHDRMQRIVRNLEKLKLQPHVMATSTLFWQGETTIVSTTTTGAAGGRREPFVRDVHATRNTLTSLWHAVITCWNVYNAVAVVFRVCFHRHLHFSSEMNAAVWIADLGCDLCFALDIYLRLFFFGSSEVTVDNLVTRKWRDRRYLRSSALKWHLVASLPIYTPYGSGSFIASTCRLPRLVRCVSLWTYLDDAIVQIQQHFASHNVSAYLSPTKLMLILVLVAHYVGSIFFFISELECEHVERCWLRDNEFSFSMLYAKSFYWAIRTLLLAGSPDIVPRDAAATLWTGFTCLSCTFIIGHIVGELSDLIQDVSKESKQFKARVANFDSFAKEHKLAEGLRTRVGFFFREQQKHTKDSDLRSTVADLSANLRLKLVLEIYGASIALLPIGRFLTPSQVNNLALRLKSELFIPGDSILAEGTMGNRLCILRRGVAAAFWTSSITSVAIMLEGAVFGEIAFFLPGQRRLATVRATSSCEVLYVTKFDWQELWLTSSDRSDVQVQKYAQRAILDWVQSRLCRYQRWSLNTAGKARRLLAACLAGPRLATAAVGALKAKRKFASILVSRRASSELTVPVPPPSTKAPTAEAKQPSSAVTDKLLLDRKAEYLHAKTQECVKMFHRSIAAARALHRSPSARSSRNLSVGKAGGNSSSRFLPSVRGDAVSSNTPDIRTLQFTVDINPVNRLVRAILTDDHLREMETECWARFKLLVTARHRVAKSLENFGFPPTPADPSDHQRFETKATPARNRVTRVRSLLFDEHASRKLEIERLVTVAAKFSECIPAKPANKWETAAAAPTLRRFLAKDSDHETQFSSSTARVSPQPNAQYRGRWSKSERVARLERMERSQSLPHFGRAFFEKLQLRENSMDSSRPGIDFERLQHYQHLQHSVNLRLIHRLKNRDHTQASIVPRLDTSLVSQMTRRNLLAATPPKPPASDAMVNAKSIRSKLSQHLITTGKHMEKAWDLIMLLIAFYHLEVTTFKVCFSVDLTEVSEPLLRRWSEFEVFLDVLCVLDLSYQLRYGSTPPRDGITPQESRHLQTHSLALRVDILAMLPLELLLGAGDVRVPETHMPHFLDPATASWWTTRWLLRTNRLLLVRRIEPLSEKLLQFLIHDRKVHVNEAVLDFVRGLATYLTMGHLLACTWFLSDKLSNIITSDISQVEVHIKGPDTSLLQKYLGALLFAMDCISTLFYGDILAMNPADVVVELGITLWSIYIYGALVGAQSDLFAARARREAAFEQTLGQLQHYLVQNEVPKEIKRQVKAYYAQLWHRRKGAAEFAPVENVSRALYEEIVLAATQTFAAQVTVFRALDDQFLRALLTCLQYVVCSANEEVFVIGDMDRSMYFIAQGRVAVKMGSSESARERGEFFGELALLYGISRLETCVALTVTELYRLDHEPYERLLLEYPEYRARNKLAWTTYCISSVRDRSVMEEALRYSRQFGVSAVHATSDSDPYVSTLETNAEKMMVEPQGIAERIDAQLPYSYIYRSAMELLSRLSKVKPLEAKELFLKSREGARRQLKAVVGVATAREGADDDVVHSFHERSTSPTDSNRRL